MRRHTVISALIGLIIGIAVPSSAAVTVNTADASGTFKAWYLSGGSWGNISTNLAPATVGPNCMILCDRVAAGRNDAYVGTGSGLFRVYAASSSSLASVGIPSGNAAQITALAYGDVDQDGYKDLCVGAYTYLDKLTWNGSSYDVTQLVNDSSGSITGIGISDYNNDGDNELICVRSDGTTFGLRYNIVTGGYDVPWLKYNVGAWAPPQKSWSGGAGTTDLNGDGVIDFVSVSGWNSSASNYYVTLMNFISPSTLNTQEIYSSPTSAETFTSVSIGNVFGNGKKDVVVTSDPGWGYRQLLIFSYNGTGWNRTVAYTWSADGLCAQTGVGDFDGDGRDEIATGEEWGRLMLHDWNRSQFTQQTLQEGGSRVIALSIGDIGIGASGSDPVVTTSGQCKNMADGSRVSLNDVVVTTDSSDFGSFVYVEQADRANAIRVVPDAMPSGLQKGSVVDITGRMDTLVSGERCISGATITITDTIDPLTPLGMVNKALK